MSLLKEAWPWIGSTEHEMGSMSKSFENTDQSANKYDMLAPEKSVMRDNIPVTNYSGGIISPVQNYSEDQLSNMIDISIKKDNKLIRTFSCKIAKSFEEKSAGLQPYKSLPEDEGLLFTYARPQDVIYHMGKVSFPIDILFIDAENEIKKICHNIQPKDLATFGCADVKFVLELNGNTCQNIGIEIGDKLSFTKKQNILKKNASDIPDPKLIYVYSFDNILNSNQTIYLYKKEKYNEDNILLDINDNIFTPGQNIAVKISELSNYDDCAISKNSNGSLKDFVKNSKENYELYEDLKYAFQEQNFIIFASNHNKDAVDLLLSKLEILYGDFSQKEYKYFKIATVENYINLIERLRIKYPNSELRIATDNSFIKKSGVNISDAVKDEARKILKLLSSAEDSLSESKDNMLQNKNEYENFAADVEKIKSTEGQYYESIRNNIKIAKQYLVYIRDSIKLLNSIKDATTTMEIIESLALSAQSCSDALQEIFDLVNSLDDPDFVNLLIQSTDSYEKAIEDMFSTIDGAKDYINTNILGILVLSN